MNKEEGYIDVPGGKVWYKITGKNKKGIPLIILHGGPGATHYNLEACELLSDERPVIFYDQLGCGNSDRPEDKSLWTIEHYVEELAVIRTTLKLEKLHIFGHSWGTMLAVDYILTEKPEGIISLILAGPCLSAPMFIEDQRRYLSEMPENIREIILECEEKKDFASKKYQDAMMIYYRKHICRVNPWPECFQKSLAGMGFGVYEYMWGPSEFTAPGTLKDYDRTDRLKDINIPSLFTCGRYDEARPETTEYYHSLIPGSEFIIFEDASHDPHIEKTEEFIKAVRDFLNKTERKFN